MFLIISFFHICASLILIFVVLLQGGKDSGLAGAFGAASSGSSDSVFGTQSNKFLSRFTTVISVLFMLTSLLLAVLFSKQHRSLLLKEKKELLVDSPVNETVAKDSLVTQTNQTLAKNSKVKNASLTKKKKASLQSSLKSKTSLKDENQKSLSVSKTEGLLSSKFQRQAKKSVESSHKDEIVKTVKHLEKKQKIMGEKSSQSQNIFKKKPSHKMLLGKTNSSKQMPKQLKINTSSQDDSMKLLEEELSEALAKTDDFVSNISKRKKETRS